MELNINSLFSISEFAMTDTKALVEHFKEKEIYDQTLAIPFPYKESDAQFWITKVLNLKAKNGRSTNWCLRRNEDGYLIGGIGYLELNLGNTHSASLGYWLAKPFWNQGIMSKAVKAACTYGIKEFGLTRISANVFEFNISSSKVLEKSGFQLEGVMRNYCQKDGRSYNAKLYSLIDNDISF